MNREEITLWYQKLQDRICQQFEEWDGTKFHEDKWERPGGGGGRSRILRDGKIFEKAGINFSAVHGEMPETQAKALEMHGGKFYATGISIVIHPRSPHLPIIHMNTRYFEQESGGWWFGGGIDLTPIYVVEKDATTFHQSLKSVCDNHSSDFYTKFKTWADDYFYNQHRKETRGVGGIFYDRLNEQSTELSKQQLFQYNCDVGSAFIDCYQPLVDQYSQKPYSEEEKQWQLIRRGRYVEFNLVYDRGTTFGLKTNGRVESILMSLPKFASWEYDHQPKKDSPEASTLGWLEKGIDWVCF